MSQKNYRVVGDPEDLTKTIIFDPGMFTFDVLMEAVRAEFPDAYEAHDRLAIVAETNEIRVWELHPLTAKVLHRN